MQSVQDQVADLVLKKGMTETDAVAEIESKLMGKLPQNVRASVHDTLDMHRYHRARQKGWYRDVTELCYFCEKKVGEAQFCYGCQNWVCSECDNNDDIPVGRHDVRDHYRAPFERRIV